MKKQIAIFALIVIAFSSCKTLTPYTDKVQTEHKWTDLQLKGAQFYTSDQICLEREMIKDMPDQIIGKIVTKNGIRKEVVYLPKKLPITFVGKTSSGNLIMQCEVKEGCKLTFGVNPDNDGKYTLLASDWKDGFGRVHYNGTEFFVPTEESNAHLLIDLHNKTNVDNNYHKAKGVKVKHNSN